MMLTDGSHKFAQLLFRLHDSLVCFSPLNVMNILNNLVSLIIP